MTIKNIDAALANEDDFDALISAAALTRIFLENARFESPDNTDDVAEGGVVGAARLTAKVNRAAAKNSNKASVAKPRSDRLSKDYPCPIPGCKHVFLKSRRGWDAHVGSHARHPDWHPEVQDSSQRIILFRREFPDWFSIACLDWTESQKTNGLDPLGMQTSSVSLYQTFLPGISNVTLRVRYCGLYAWLCRTYAEKIGDTNPKIWQRIVRHSEALDALIGHKFGDETGMAGTQ
ncbi:MAG: hypothetical protein WBM81_19205 [Sedimenticolaceae bacterium]